MCVKGDEVKMPKTIQVLIGVVKLAHLTDSRKIWMKQSVKKLLSHSYTAVCVTLYCCLQELSLRVTVAEATDDGRGENLGHVIIGPEASGMGITHWNQMLATLRKPVSMWHPLRRI